MQKTVVINIVGLSQSVLGDYTPNINTYIKKHQLQLIQPVLPAVTTSVQSTYVTGTWPNEHGIVGNGWYDRTDCEIKFWKQSNKLVHGEKIWERAKALDPNFTCAKMFWWYNMYSSADYSATPRPQYHADGVKKPDCYTHPDYLRDDLQAELGTFPLFNFWGPNTSIASSQWILDASIKVDQKYQPTLSLIYLPHLDYGLQKYGPDHPAMKKDLLEIDQLVNQAIQYYESQNAKIILLSEYGINPVHQPIAINRWLRSKGWLSVRKEEGRELLDAGASKVFAVADHQIAHLYLNDKELKSTVIKELQELSDIDLILYDEQLKEYHLDHERCGDIVLVAEPHAWFSYYYWNEEKAAPDFAHMVDIHRKPGYDPVELFMDPKNKLIKLKAAYKILRKKLGFRYRLNVIPTDANLVKGSHGSPRVDPVYYPIIVAPLASSQNKIAPTEVYQIIWETLTHDKK